MHTHTYTFLCISISLLKHGMANISRNSRNNFSIYSLFIFISIFCLTAY